MNYPTVSLSNAAEELNRLHGGIEDKLRSTVADAIRAGEILTQVKDRMSHGDFLPWIKSNCRFAQSSAYRYMQVFEYQNKITSVGNLQEAYTQIETMEAQRRMSEEQRAGARVDAYLKTGEKPEDWRRGTDDKLAEEKRGREERAEKIQQDIAREHAERMKERPAEIGYDDIDRILEETTDQAVKRAEFKERIRVSHEGKADPFVDAIMDYLNGLEDDNRRVEACYNIIKVCKGIANQLQVKE